MFAKILVDEKNSPFFYIYFLRSSETGLVKVGRTKNLIRRIATLTEEMGGHLYLLCSIPTFDHSTESYVVQLLKPYRATGREWFYIDDKDLRDVIVEVVRGVRHWTDEPIARVRQYELVEGPR